MNGRNGGLDRSGLSGLRSPGCLNCGSRRNGGCHRFGRRRRHGGRGLRRCRLSWRVGNCGLVGGLRGSRGVRRRRRCILCDRVRDLGTLDGGLVRGCCGSARGDHGLRGVRVRVRGCMGLHGGRWRRRRCLCWSRCGRRGARWRPSDDVRGGGRCCCRRDRSRLRFSMVLRGSSWMLLMMLWLGSGCWCGMLGGVRIRSGCRRCLGGHRRLWNGGGIEDAQAFLKILGGYFVQRAGRYPGARDTHGFGMGDNFLALDSQLPGDVVNPNGHK